MEPPDCLHPADISVLIIQTVIAKGSEALDKISLFESVLCQ